MHPKDVLNQLVFRLIGTPYLWGGACPLSGLDCSGLCIYLLGSVGILPPGYDATAEGLRERFPAVSQAQATFGDLVLFGKPGAATHIGMYLGDGLMVEAGGGDHTTVSLARAIEQKAHVRVSPISRRKDLLGFVRPPYGVVN